jgi:hypothetical protein
MAHSLTLIAVIFTIALVQTFCLFWEPSWPWTLEDQDFCCALNTALYE